MASHTRLSGPPSGPHAAEDLGHSTHLAMWVGCAIAFVASVFGTIASLGGGVIFWVICAVLVVVAYVAFVVLSRMGHGQYTNKEIDSAQDAPTVGIS